MNILKKEDGGSKIELTEEETRLFIEYFLKRCQFGSGQEAIDAFIKSYEYPGQIPYEYMLQ